MFVLSFLFLFALSGTVLGQVPDTLPTTNVQEADVQQTDPPAESRPNVTIATWQYCEGCKETVEVYSKEAANVLLNMNRVPGKKKEFDAASVIHHMCDNPHFAGFAEFAKLSCIKILDEYRAPFLAKFTGSTTTTSLTNKREMFEKKKDVSMCIFEGISSMKQSSLLDIDCIRIRMPPLAINL